MDGFWKGYILLMLGVFIGFYLLSSEEKTVEEKPLPVEEIKEGVSMAFETLFSNEGMAIFMLTFVALTSLPMMIKIFKQMH